MWKITASDVEDNSGCLLTPPADLSASAFAEWMAIGDDLPHLTYSQMTKYVRKSSNKEALKIITKLQMLTRTNLYLQKNDPEKQRSRSQNCFNMEIGVTRSWHH